MPSRDRLGERQSTSCWITRDRCRLRHPAFIRSAVESNFNMYNVYQLEVGWQWVVVPLNEATHKEHHLHFQLRCKIKSSIRGACFYFLSFLLGYKSKSSMRLTPCESRSRKWVAKSWDMAIGSLFALFGSYRPSGSTSFALFIPFFECL